ncbi:uncharacterized protein [Apostichopus japonicus]|uniref:uncharacterized protein isoform X2 n=1 Tax=Stichopus japonicus TaxID=307972 RepID=UPI003AB5FDA4
MLYSTLCSTFADLELEEPFTVKYMCDEWKEWIDVSPTYTLEKKLKFRIDLDDDSSDALVDHLASSSGSSQSAGMKKRLTTIVESLKMRKQLKENEGEGTIRKKKAQVSIQLGWQHSKIRCNLKQYTQVRAGNGGGVATIRLERTSSYNSVLERAKEVFFPNGISLKHGSADDLDLHLANFRGQGIDRDTFSVDDLYQEAGSKLRIYLMSTPKKQLTLSSVLDPEAAMLDDLFEEDIPPARPSTSTSQALPGLQRYHSRGHQQELPATFVESVLTEEKNPFLSHVAMHCAQHVQCS